MEWLGLPGHQVSVGQRWQDRSDRRSVQDKRQQAALPQGLVLGGHGRESRSTVQVAVRDARRSDTERHLQREVHDRIKEDPNLLLRRSTRSTFPSAR